MPTAQGAHLKDSRSRTTSDTWLALMMVKSRRRRRGVDSAGPGCAVGK